MIAVAGLIGLGIPGVYKLHARNGSLPGALFATTLGLVRKPFLSIGAMAALLAVTGCALVPTPFACTTIGYTAVASVDISQPTAGLRLELCAGERCTPGPVEVPVEIGATATPLPTGVFELSGNSRTGWTATFLDAQPQLGYRLTDKLGTVAAEGYIDVEWIRVDGSEQCGGNMRADVVIDL